MAKTSSPLAILASDWQKLKKSSFLKQLAQM